MILQQCLRSKEQEDEINGGPEARPQMGKRLGRLGRIHLSEARCGTIQVRSTVMAATGQRGLRPDRQTLGCGLG